MCRYGEGESDYDGYGTLEFGLMFHGFDYPDETGTGELHARFWRARMDDGVVRFLKPEACSSRKFVRQMTTKRFGESQNFRDVEAESMDWEI